MEVGEDRDALTHAVIGAAIEVHREMGPGLLESIYQKCLESELRRSGIVCLPQARLPLVYKGEELGDEFILDTFFSLVVWSSN
jgi:GxxExxY protein